MNDKRDFDRAVDRWLDAGSDATPPEVIDAVLLAARNTPQERDFRISWRTSPMKRLGYAVAAVAVLAISVTALTALSRGFGIGVGPTPSEEPSVDLGIFEPVAGRIVFVPNADRFVFPERSGIWGVDPTAPGDPATWVQLTAEADTPLAWSSDGTRLLITRGSPDEEHLLVLHADGSEIQMADRPMSIGDATFSADGSRVVFVATELGDGEWAAYSIDADGGPATMLTSQIHPSPAASTFSPDGTRIAYVAWGRGDSEHPVWVMDADGTGAHEILANDIVMGGGHVRDRGGALAWSPTGDRIALGLGGAIYTFAPDGSGFTRVITRGDLPYWSADGSQIAYTISCIEDPDGCGLAIADADGSNVLTLGIGGSGPWHPGTLEQSAGR